MAVEAQLLTSLDQRPARTAARLDLDRAGKYLHQCVLALRAYDKAGAQGLNATVPSQYPQRPVLTGRLRRIGAGIDQQFAAMQTNQPLATVVSHIQCGIGIEGQFSAVVQVRLRCWPVRVA
ncbi:hypothetical protein ULF88_22165 [Halopseudomonas pachastrellae]|nr:hypothetical protein [Halopseudomonas pachastrellae]